MWPPVMTGAHSPCSAQASQEQSPAPVPLCMSARTLWLATLGVMAMLALHATVAFAARPQFVSIAVTPSVFQAAGGPFVVTARVRNARTCRADAEQLIPRRLVNCVSGHITLRGYAPANATATTTTRWLDLEAYSGRHSGYSRAVRIEVLPREPVPAAVNGIDTCTPGPECDYGATGQSFQNWGNAAPLPLGDCTFAAAADWEQMVLGVHANPALIGYEYAKAGGGDKGLAQGALWSYWRSPGIAGVHLTGLHSYDTTAADVQNGVRDYGAMIAELSFGSNWGFGPYTMGATRHYVVVGGFTPEGPLVVTWGETIQMTWEQWNAEAVTMWGIGTS